ncbi:glycosyltransferase family 4 protein [Empedobacter falsenii]
MKLVVGITAPLSVILIKGQLKYFSDLGVKVFLLAPKTKETVEFCKLENVTLLPVDIKRDINITADILALRTIYKHLQNIKPDVINIGTPKMGLLGSIAGWLTKTPKVIYTCRGFRFEHEKGVKQKVLKYLDRFAISKADKVICISESVKQLGLKEQMFLEDKAIIFGKGSSNGLDLEFFNPGLYTELKKEELKSKYNIKEKFVFGFVGRIVDRKGINELYDAFVKVQAKDSDVHLLIVGKANLEQVSDPSLIEKLENNPQVTLTGYVENVNDYMAVMNMFVLPAWWEGFGNTLIQAAAMGLPIISCNVTGCKDAVSNLYNGILLPPKDTKLLYRTMIELKNNDQEMKRLGQNGVIWSKNFDSQYIWKNMKDLYES